MLTKSTEMITSIVVKNFLKLHSRTRLGGNHAPLEPNQSIQAMLHFVANEFQHTTHNGQFLDYKGNIMPF